jgi:hypothetical protein
MCNKKKKYNAQEKKKLSISILYCFNGNLPKPFIYIIHEVKEKSQKSQKKNKYPAYRVRLPTQIAHTYDFIMPSRQKKEKPELSSDTLERILFTSTLT